MARYLELSLDQGATLSQKVNYQDSNKSNLSLSGYDVRAQLRRSHYSANAYNLPVSISDAANGEVTISLSANVSSGLKAGRWLYDVEANTAADASVIRIVEGIITVMPGVTGTASIITPLVTTTSEIPEGANLYYTNTRVQAYVNNLAGNIIPSQDNVYSLGNATNRFKGLFIVGSTINIGNAAIKFEEGSFKFQDETGAPAKTEIYTANIIESGTVDSGNVFFTRDRARGSLGNSTGVFYNSTTGVFSIGQAVGTADNVSFNNVTVTGSLLNVSTSSIAEGTNLYFTNNRVWANIAPQLATKANVSDLANVSLSSQTTSNLIEGANLYFTNARARAALSAFDTSIIYDAANGTIKANVSALGGANVISINGQDGIVVLSTSDIYEGANLYFTNNRVWANIAPRLAGLTTANIAEDTNLYFTNARVYANVIGLGYATTAYVNSSLANVSISNLSTSNVAEGANLYFTNARVYANVIGLGYATTSYVDGAVANLVNSAPAALDTLNELATALGNDASFASTVTNLIATKANTASLTTANVTELTNLYFTNARARGAISVTGSGSYDNSTGVITVTGGVTSVNGQTGTVVLTTANIAEGANLYFTNARVYANVVGLLGLKANSADLTTANVAETTNLYFTNARVYANVVGLLGLKANSADLTTSNVAEGTGLYFTNARARQAITVTGAGSYDNTTGIITITSQAGSVNSVNGANGNVVLTTTDIAEGSNLYFSNARVQANVAGLSINILADVNTAGAATGNTLVWDGTNWVPGSSGTAVTAKKFSFTIASSTGVISGTDNSGLTLSLQDPSNAHVFVNGILLTKTLDYTAHTANLVLVSNVEANNIVTIIDSMVYVPNVSEQTTTTVAEGANLYFTNARVYANVVGLLGLKANLADLTTANVAETTGLYFTNTRVWANVGANIGNINGWLVSHNTTSGIAEGTNLYFSNARARAALGTANASTLIYYEANGNFQVNVTTSSGVTTGKAIAMAIVFGG